MDNPYRDPGMIAESRPRLSRTQAFLVGVRSAFSLKNPLTEVALHALDGNESLDEAHKVTYLSAVCSSVSVKALKSLREIRKGMERYSECKDENSPLAEQLFQDLLRASWQRAEVEEHAQILKKGNRARAVEPAYRNWCEDDIPRIEGDPKASETYHRLLHSLEIHLYEANLLVLGICSGSEKFPAKQRDIADSLAEAAERSNTGIQDWVKAKAIIAPAPGSVGSARRSLKVLRRIRDEIDAGTPERSMERIAPIDDRIIYALEKARGCVASIATEAKRCPGNAKMRNLLEEAKCVLHEICDNSGKHWTREASVFAKELQRAEW